MQEREWWELLVDEEEEVEDEDLVEAAYLVDPRDDPRDENYLDGRDDPRDERFEREPIPMWLKRRSSASRD